MLYVWQMGGDVTPIKVAQNEHWLVSSLIDSSVIALSYVFGSYIKVGPWDMY